MIGYQSSTRESNRLKNVLFRSRLIFFIMVAFFGVFNSTEAHSAPFALTCLQRPSPPPGFTTLPSGGTPGSRYTGFTDRFIGCLEDGLVILGRGQFATIRTQVKRAVTVSIALFIIFFAYRMMFANLGSTARDDYIVMIFKLAGVALASFYAGLEFFFPLFIYAQGFLVETVSVGMGASPPCDIFPRVWQRIDCSVANMFGATISSPGNPTVSPYVAGARTPWILPSYIMARLFTPTILSGFVELIIFINLLFFFIVAVAGAAVNYIMSFMALVMLFLFAPVVIPTILFQFTRDIFSFWFRAVVGYTVQPMLLFAYMTFMINALNYVIIGPGSLGVDEDGVITVNDSTPLGMLQFMGAIHTEVMTYGHQTHKPWIQGQTRVEEQCASGSRTGGEVRQVTEAGFAIDIPRFSYVRQPGNFCYRYMPTPRPGVVQTVEEVYQECVQNAMYVNLVVLTIMSCILLNFMGNVARFGNDLVGLNSSGSFTEQFSFYSKASAAMREKAASLNKKAKEAAIEVAKIAKVMKRDG